MVTNIYDNQARKLSQTLHSITVRNNLLQHENLRLKEALVNKKKRRQRGKPLLLKAPKDYHGGAVFWSPTKVKDARDRQVQKDAKEKALQLQKSEETKQREARKAEKARILKERKRIRATTKKIRLQEQQKKKAQQEKAKMARQAEQQLKNDLKQSRKGKSKVITPRLPSPIEIVDDEASDVNTGPIPA